MQVDSYSLNIFCKIKSTESMSLAAGLPLLIFRSFSPYNQKTKEYGREDKTHEEDKEVKTYSCNINKSCRCNIQHEEHDQ